MYLVAGLGNPGDDYAYTWHNCGFLALEMLADKNKIVLNKSKFKGVYGQGRIGGEQVILVKPQTFMNNSGECIAPLARYYNIEPSHVIVIYDDIDIPTSKVRVRPSGSAGTHNGMKSVIACLGTRNFPRVRIGTGPVPEHRELVEYVLSGIPKDIRPEVFASFETAVKATEELIGANEQKNK